MVRRTKMSAASEMPTTADLPFDLFGSAGDLMDINMDSREILFFEEVTPQSVISVIKAIKEINAEDDLKATEAALNKQPYVRNPIKLVINTPGGHAIEGFALIAVIEASVTPVHTYAIGQVASMGIPLLCSGTKSFTFPYTRFMIHTVASGTIGTISTMRTNMKETEVIHNMLNDYITKNSNVTKELLEKIEKSNSDYYFGPDEAISLGIVEAYGTT